MQIGVIGCGRWGSFIAWYLDHIGHSVTLYGRPGSKNMEQFVKTRSNGLLTLRAEIGLTTALKDALAPEIVVISIDAQNLRALAAEIAGLHAQNKVFVLCMKGIEEHTCARLSTIMEESVAPTNRTAVWIGPGHVQEFLAGVPNCMVIDSADEAVKRMLVDAFASKLIRFYYGEDLLGNEIGAAAKNPIGIAAGILDGLGLSTLKGALTSRGTREISRLIDALGGNPLSAYGLCHLGDYGATVFSEYSHNRRYGEAFVKGERFLKLAEGVTSVSALVELGGRCGVELPICSAVQAVIHEGADARSTIARLFTRSLKGEFSPF